VKIGRRVWENSAQKIDSSAFSWGIILWFLPTETDRWRGNSRPEKTYLKSNWAKETLLGEVQAFSDGKRSSAENITFMATKGANPTPLPRDN